ncbi:pilus assembly protein CpaE [uncultured Nocardioides sp.]|uniref:pilus assembly protein CpaE n=1 Tax=uncultured Nocardioides sp. TaxID=198441 RepID=UPI0025D072A7|nr:pilus assembly protein CpaE [uncultured Nocardioides sp.]
MITLELARRVGARLAAAGHPWQPGSGDRFIVPDRGLDQVFVVAEMTIEVAEYPTGTLIRFNGTTEWALDTVEAREVVWLPWEHQLRAALGDRFERLERVPGPAEGFVVVTTDGERHADVDVEGAYARALLGG